MTTNKHSSQRIPLLLLSLALLVVIAVIAINVLQARYNQLSSSLGKLQVATPTPEFDPVPTLLQTKPAPLSLDQGKWMTYTNSEFGFSFQYPAEWKLYTNNEKYFAPAVGEIAFLFDGAVWRSHQDTRYNGFIIIVYPNPQHLAPEDWIRTTYGDKNNLIKFGDPNVQIGHALNQIVITDEDQWAKENNVVVGPDIGQLVQSNKKSSLLFDVRLGGPTFWFDVSESGNPYKAITSSFFFSK